MWTKLSSPLQEPAVFEISEGLEEFVHLHLNRPSDQLSSRTPAAIFGLDVRDNASPTGSPNCSRDHSAFGEIRAVRPYTAFHIESQITSLALSCVCGLFFSLAALLLVPVVCFQWFADSFCKNRGVWGVCVRKPL